ncbi:MAG: hypothetical protein GY716_06885 [bacterium]|nr:hypothetical protein [bacterium]
MRTPVFCAFNGWQESVAARLYPSASPIILTMPTDATTLADLVEASCSTTVVLHFNVSDSRAIIRDRARFLDDVAARGGVVFNADVIDVRKRALQRWLEAEGMPTVVAPLDGPPEQPLVVKTDLNARGKPERRLPTTVRRELGLSVVDSPLIAHDHYYLVMERSAVPGEWWTDDSLMIERYVTNRERLIYRTFVAGAKIAIVEGVADRPLGRIGRDTARMTYLLGGPADPVLAGAGPRVRALFEAVTEFVRGFGLGFGAVDFAIADDGIPHIVDVNTTPQWGAEELDDRLAAHLRAGLEAAHDG